MLQPNITSTSTSLGDDFHTILMWLDIRKSKLKSVLSQKSPKKWWFFCPTLFEAYGLPLTLLHFFSILLMLHTNGSTSKGARENLVSFYIVLKFLDPRVQNTKISKFPPKTFKIRNFSKCKNKIKNSSCEYLKMHKNYLFICVLILDNNAMKSR